MRVAGARGMSGKPNLYCIVKMERERHRTGTSKADANAKWSSVFKFSCSPTVHQIDVELFEEGLLGDKSVGACAVPFAKLRRGIIFDQWVALTGTKKNVELRLRILPVDIGQDPTAEEIEDAKAKQLYNPIGGVPTTRVPPGSAQLGGAAVAQQSEAPAQSPLDASLSSTQGVQSPFIAYPPDAPYPPAQANAGLPWQAARPPQMYSMGLDASCRSAAPVLDDHSPVQDGQSNSLGPSAEPQYPPNSVAAQLSQLAPADPPVALTSPQSQVEPSLGSACNAPVPLIATSKYLLQLKWIEVLLRRVSTDDNATVHALAAEQLPKELPFDDYVDAWRDLREKLHVPSQNYTEEEITMNVRRLEAFTKYYAPKKVDECPALVQSMAMSGSLDELWMRVELRFGPEDSVPRETTVSEPVKVATSPSRLTFAWLLDYFNFRCIDKSTEELQKLLPVNPESSVESFLQTAKRAQEEYGCIEDSDADETILLQRIKLVAKIYTQTGCTDDAEVFVRLRTKSGEWHMAILELSLRSSPPWTSEHTLSEKWLRRLLERSTVRLPEFCVVQTVLFSTWQEIEADYPINDTLTEEEKGKEESRVRAFCAVYDADSVAVMKAFEEACASGLICSFWRSLEAKYGPDDPVDSGPVDDAAACSSQGIKAEIQESEGADIAVTVPPSSANANAGQLGLQPAVSPKPQAHVDNPPQQQSNQQPLPAQQPPSSQQPLSAQQQPSSQQPLSAQQQPYASQPPSAQQPQFNQQPAYASQPLYAPQQPTYAPQQQFNQQPTCAPQQPYASQQQFNQQPTYAPQQPYASQQQFNQQPTYAPQQPYALQQQFNQQPTYAPQQPTAQQHQFIGPYSSAPVYSSVPQYVNSGIDLSYSYPPQQSYYTPSQGFNSYAPHPGYPPGFPPQSYGTYPMGQGGPWCPPEFPPNS